MFLVKNWAPKHLFLKNVCKKVTKVEIKYYFYKKIK